MLFRMHDIVHLFRKGKSHTWVVNITVNFYHRYAEQLDLGCFKSILILFVVNAATENVCFAFEEQSEKEQI